MPPTSVEAKPQAFWVDVAESNPSRIVEYIMHVYNPLKTQPFRTSYGDTPVVCMSSPMS